MFTSKTKATFETNIVENPGIVVVLWENLNICKWYRTKTKGEEGESERVPGRKAWIQHEMMAIKLWNLTRHNHPINAL